MTLPQLRDQKKKIVSQTTQKKTFNYTRKDLNLCFTLEVDSKSQMLGFLELLMMATEDLGKEVQERFGKNKKS